MVKLVKYKVRGVITVPWVAEVVASNYSYANLKADNLKQEDITILEGEAYGQIVETVDLD